AAGLVTSAHPEYPQMVKMKQDATEKLAASQPKPAEQPAQGPAQKPEVAMKQPVPEPAQPSQLPSPAGAEGQQKVAAASLAQAQKLMEWHQYDQAREQARIAMSQGASDAEVSSLMKKIDVQQKLGDLRSAVANKDWPEAQNLIREIEAADPSNSEVNKFEKTVGEALAKTKTDDLLNSGILAFYSGRYQQTIDLLQRSLPSNETAEAHFYIGCS